MSKDDDGHKALLTLLRGGVVRRWLSDEDIIWLQMRDRLHDLIGAYDLVRSGDTFDDESLLAIAPRLSETTLKRHSLEAYAYWGERWKPLPAPEHHCVSLLGAIIAQAELFSRPPNQSLRAFVNIAFKEVGVAPPTRKQFRWVCDGKQ